MSMTETVSNPDPDAPEWSKPAILRREFDRSTDLTDGQKAVIATAVRNPDTTVKAVCDKHDVYTVTLRNLFWRMEMGTVGGGENVDYDARLNDGTSAFTDHTVIRRAAIDFVARHPDAFDELTYHEVAERVSDELGVDAHHTTLYNTVTADCPGAAKARREWYVRHGMGEQIERFADMDDVGEQQKDERSLRELLTDAGVSKLPDEHLDDMPTAGEAREQAREQRQTSDDSSSDGSDDSDDVAMTTQPGLPDDDGAVSEPETVVEADVTGGDGGEQTERQVGNASYKGPSTGLNLAGGRPSKVLVGPEEADSPSVTDELQRVREECGPYGEKAADRDLDISDRESLEHEIKVLRILVAQQGEYINQLRTALDNMFVNVEAGFTIPTGDEDNGGDDK